MAKKVKKKELGLGIRALLSNIEEETAENQEQVVKELSSAVAMLPINQIRVNPYQPRNEFDEDALNELSESIKIHGLIQPITVRRLGPDEYQLISGERRLRASKQATLKEIPAYIRLANDQQMLEMALIENIQREDLNGIEIAITYKRLKDECDLTDEKLSERVGKKRTTITNYLRLLKLPPDIQEAIKERKISFGHGRSLAGVEDIALRSSFFHRTISEGLSVHALDRLIKAYDSEKKEEKKAASAKSALPEAYVPVQDNLKTYLGAKVEIKVKSKGKGQIVIPFTSDADLNRLLDLIESQS